MEYIYMCMGVYVFLYIKNLETTILGDIIT